MAIVPSGKLRIMEAQNLQTDINNQSANRFDGIESADVPEERNAIQQQPIEDAGEDVMSGPTEQAGNITSTEPIQEQPVQDQFEQQQKEEEAPVEETEYSDLQAFVYGMLEKIGVEKRQLMNLSKQIYSEETDLQSGILVGHYMIPSFTNSQKITKDIAAQIAKKVGDRFNLSQKLKWLPVQVKGKQSGAGNWRIEFRTAPKQENVENGGNSFDGLYEDNKKTASTLNELIKDRKDELYNTLRKIAQKE